MSCEVYWDAVPLRKRQNARLHMHLCTKVMGSSGVTIMIYHTRVQYLVYVGVQVCKPLTPNMKDTPPEPLQQRLFGARLLFFVSDASLDPHDCVKALDPFDPLLPVPGFVAAHP